MFEPLEISAKEKTAMELAFANVANSFSIRYFKNNGLFSYQRPHVLKAIASAFESCLNPHNAAYLKERLFNLSIDNYAYLTGFPQGELIETPKHAKSKPAPHISEFISIGLIGLAGRQLNHLKIGNVVLHDTKGLTPLEGTDVSAEPFHTHADMADYGILYCLKGSKNVTSVIVTASSLITHITDPDRNLLFKPLHYFGADKPATPLLKMKGELSVFSPEWTANENFLSYLATTIDNMVRESNPDAAEATNIARAIVDKWLDASTSVNYKPGDVAIINQHSTIRGILINGVNKHDVKDRYLLSTTAQLGVEVETTINMQHAANVLHCAKTVRSSQQYISL